MSQTSLQRFYAISGLNFRDFWDLCLHFQRVCPTFKSITWTVDGFRSYIVLEETDVYVVLRKLAETKDTVRKFVGRFTGDPSDPLRDPGMAELAFRPEPYDDHGAGLSFHADHLPKIALYAFEELIYDRYQLEQVVEPKIEFGLPCEVLCGMFDMRGFSVFCEQPNIESPYTCGVMTAFYHLVKATFAKYPPDLLKFAGDGVTAIWQTTVEDRAVAIDVLMRGATSINQQWQFVRRNPHFSHGTPEEIGCGISFGLASRLTVDHDYIGRPINLAARLCGVCPGGKVLVDKIVPKVPDNLDKRETRVRIKSFGDYAVWQVNCD